jgi:1-acyl-sn-glycerol-3-phosphate acyltransferase
MRPTVDNDDPREHRGRVNDDLPNLQTPPPVRFRWGNQALRWYFAPQYLHLDRVEATRPTLFVGNHSVFGVLDVMLFADGLYRAHGICLRSLADRNHFKVPVWRDFVVQTGAVLGSRANCAALMRKGEHILVFPGGAREVFKHKGEAYRLIWKERFGFVRLAIEHGYTITPYATVGAEEAFDVLLDSGDYMRTPVGRYLKDTGIAGDYLRGGEEFPPVVRGLGLTMIPRPEKLYFSIGKPIDTVRYRDHANDPAVLQRVRARVGRSLSQLIAEGRERRAQDTGQGALRRLLNRL